MPPLTPDQWQEVSPYLDEVLEIAPERRAAWLLSLSEKNARWPVQLHKDLWESAESGRNSEGARTIEIPDESLAIRRLATESFALPFSSAPARAEKRNVEIRTSALEGRMPRQQSILQNVDRSFEESCGLPTAIFGVQ